MLKKVLLMLMLLPVLSFADTPRGEKLVKTLWKDIKERNVAKIKEYTSKEFQAQTFDATFNRYEELTLIQNSNIETYTFSDIQATQGENSIVVTYALEITENTTDGQETVSGPLISVWKKTDDEWKWVAQADFTG